MASALAGQAVRQPERMALAPAARAVRQAERAARRAAGWSARVTRRPVSVAASPAELWGSVGFRPGQPRAAQRPQEDARAEAPAPLAALTPWARSLSAVGRSSRELGRSALKTHRRALVPCRSTAFPAFGAPPTEAELGEPAHGRSAAWTRASRVAARPAHPR